MDGVHQILKAGRTKIYTGRNIVPKVFHNVTPLKYSVLRRSVLRCLFIFADQLNEFFRRVVQFNNGASDKEALASRGLDARCVRRRLNARAAVDRLGDFTLAQIADAGFQLFKAGLDILSLARERLNL